jgi:hypothetical protein
VGAHSLLIGLLPAYLPAYTDRMGFWTLDGDVARWLGTEDCSSELSRILSTRCNDRTDSALESQRSGTAAGSSTISSMSNMIRRRAPGIRATASEIQSIVAWPVSCSRLPVPKSTKSARPRSAEARSGYGC